MKFSVLIAAYHAAPFLPTALASLVAQDHCDWELIVVEDGSHDETEDLVSAFAASHPDHAITYQNLGVNCGVAAARNRLLDLAQGDAVAFLDADDQWAPSHLSDLGTALRTGAAIAISAIEIWNSDEQVSLGVYAPPIHWITEPRRWLFEHSFIQTSSCVALPKESIIRTGRMDENLDIGEDRDYWLRTLAGGHTLACTQKATCRYTKHHGSSMTKTLQVAADTVAFYRKYREDASFSVVLRRRMLAKALWIHGRLKRDSDRIVARLLFRAAVFTWPFAPSYWPYLAL